MSKNEYTRLETIKASEFKAQCLKLMEQVAEGTVEYLVTKNGCPKARLTSCRPTLSGTYGKDRDRINITGDIVSPVADAVWDADMGKLLSTDTPLADSDSS